MGAGLRMLPLLLALILCVRESTALVYGVVLCASSRWELCSKQSITISRAEADSHSTPSGTGVYGLTIFSQGSSPPAASLLYTITGANGATLTRQWQSHRWNAARRKGGRGGKSSSGGKRRRKSTGGKSSSGGKTSTGGKSSSGGGKSNGGSSGGQSRASRAILGTTLLASWYRRGYEPTTEGYAGKEAVAASVTQQVQWPLSQGQANGSSYSFCARQNASHSSACSSSYPQLCSTSTSGMLCQYRLPQPWAREDLLTAAFDSSEITFPVTLSLAAATFNYADAGTPETWRKPLFVTLSGLEVSDAAAGTSDFPTLVVLMIVGAALLVVVLLLVLGSVFAGTAKIAPEDVPAQSYKEYKKQRSRRPTNSTTPV